MEEMEVLYYTIDGIDYIDLVELKLEGGIYHILANENNPKDFQVRKETGDLEDPTLELVTEEQELQLVIRNYLEKYKK